MNAARTTTLGLGTLSLVLCLGAQAQTSAPESGPRTIGGTSYSGSTDSASPTGRTRRNSPDYLPAGEASTFINGQPNVNPDLPAWTPRPTATQTMGGPGMSYDARTGSAMKPHPLWGTPD